MNGTVILAVIRLIVVYKNDNTWLEDSKFSLKTVCVLIIAWVHALFISLPPLFGLGRYGQDMVGVRYIFKGLK